MNQNSRLPWVSLIRLWTGNLALGFDSVFDIGNAQAGRNNKPKTDKVDFHMIAAIVTVAAMFASDPISD